MSILGSVLKSFATTAIDAARLGVIPTGAPQQQGGRRKKKVECTPCAAAARVDAARKRMLGK